MKKISSRENPVFKQFRGLLSSARERRKQGLTLLDGAHLLDAFLRAGGVPRTVVIEEAALENDEIQCLVGMAKLEPIVLSAAMMREISPVDTPTGVVAAVAVPEPEPLGEEDWVVLDDVQDAGNVGTILRSAAAAGVRDVLLSQGCAQPWSPKVLRAGMGAHFSLRIHESMDLPRVLAAYKGQCLATFLGAEVSVYDCDLSGPVAWLFGSEGAGLRPEVMACASKMVQIPMAAEVESLNVASAAAVCLFEQVRQRRRCGGGAEITPRQ